MDYNRKHKCKYCDYRGTRDQLVNHTDSKHKEHVTEEYPASRIVYNYLNGVENGKCIICGKPTKWNDKTWKYYRHCGSRECVEKIKETYRKNAVAKDGKYNYANDPEHLKKMLAGRKISGVYTCSDGSKKTYTGSYERKTIEFMDKVLQVDPKDVLMPGPIFDYEYNGETHQWITDIYYLPYNLVIEVKDGGDNPNMREMKEYREKQLAKEKAIIASGTYNYLRLTNNNFVQLIEIFATLRMAMLDDTKETREAIIRINEDVRLETCCAIKPDIALLLEYDKNHQLKDIGITDMSSAYCLMPRNGKLKSMSKSDVSYYTETYLVNNINADCLKQIKSMVDKNIDNYALFEIVCGKKFVSDIQLVLEDNLTQLSIDDDTFVELTENALNHKNDVFCLESACINEVNGDTIGKLQNANIKLMNSLDGYFLESIGIYPALATTPTTSLYDTISKIDDFSLIVAKYGR